MNIDLYDEIAKTLTGNFHVDASLVRPDATLASLGMDSLTLMEFVFAIEDRYNTRIPEDKLDPRQAGLTLERVVQALEDELPAASSARAAAA
jgi:acyl carrier protein